MENEFKTATQKLHKRPEPTKDQYPIFIVKKELGKLVSEDDGKVIYKITSPHAFMALYIISKSVDVRIREYSEKVFTQIYLDYLSGTPEYQETTSYEFEKLYNEVEGLTRAWVQTKSKG